MQDDERFKRAWSHRENIVIDTKSRWYGKSLLDIKMLIYEEIYGKDWHINVAKEIGMQLNEFKVSVDSSEIDASNELENRQKGNSIIPSAKESLKRKHKGQRISLHERIYLFKSIKRGDKSMAWIAIDNNLSLGTLYQIKKEFETPINKRLMKAPITSRNLINSSYLQSIIYNYL